MTSACDLLFHWLEHSKAVVQEKKKNNFCVFFLNKCPKFRGLHMVFDEADQNVPCP